MTHLKIAGLALAGGTAVRMGGGDKPLLEIAGRPMLKRVIAVLSADAAAVAISANGDPARFAAFGLPVIPDNPFAGLGPLAGILAGLDWAAGLGADALLTLPGDTPFVPPGLATRLTPAPAFAESGGESHFLVALWPVPVRQRLRLTLTGPGPYGVARFGKSIGMRAVAFPAGPPYRFLNVNTPEDLKTAQAVGTQSFPLPFGRRNNE